VINECSPMMKTVAVLSLVLLVGVSAAFGQTLWGLKATYYSNNPGPGGTADRAALNIAADLLPVVCRERCGSISNASRICATTRA
jgi:hypothetical protein